MSLYKRDGSPYWWYSIPHPHGNGRIRKSTGETDKKKAQRAYDEEKARLWKVKSTGRQLSDALSAWYDVRDRSVNDRNAVKQIMREYKDRPLFDVTLGSIEDIFGRKSPGTFNRLVAIIRASLNIAHSRGWIGEVPKLPRKTEPKKRIRFLTHEEADRLIAAMPPHLRPMVIFSLETGLRWANVTYLEWSQISIERKIAWVHPDQAKAGKTITVHLSNEAISVLKNQMNIDDVYVFTYRGKPISSPKTAWKSACAKAGIKNFRWHDLRHTWASWHVQNGTPLAVLKEYGGWAHIDMVLKYAHLAPNHIAQYANNTKPAAKKNGMEEL